MLKRPFLTWRTDEKTDLFFIQNLSDFPGQLFYIKGLLNKVITAELHDLRSLAVYAVATCKKGFNFRIVLWFLIN